MFHCLECLDLITGADLYCSDCNKKHELKGRVLESIGRSLRELEIFSDSPEPCSCSYPHPHVEDGILCRKESDREYRAERARRSHSP